MSKQTSVEWIIEQIQSFGIDTRFINKSMEIAKEMEKKQIVDAWNDGWENQPFRENNQAELYYNNTFKQPKKD